MKLAVSNIAWDVHDDPEILSLLRELGVDGVEVAPTKIWPNWEGATADAAAGYRRFLASKGFEIPSFQAIVYGRPDLKLFESEARRAAFLKHLTRVADLAQAMDARRLVFGAPKNRRREALSSAEAEAIAVPLFRKAAELCHSRDTVFCLEPNPPDYHCDFATHAEEGRLLVEKVDHPGFRLHLDAAGMLLAGDDPAQAIGAAGPLLAHFHASEPMLGDFSQPADDHHRRAAAELRRIGYDGWVSIEMRMGDRPAAQIGQAVRYAREVYG